MKPLDAFGGITNACEHHGTELLVRPATDGTDTKIAFCRVCRRYYGRLMNSPQVQAQGFRPAQHQPRKAKQQT